MNVRIPDDQFIGPTIRGFGASSELRDAELETLAMASMSARRLASVALVVAVSTTALAEEQGDPAPDTKRLETLVGRDLRELDRPDIEFVRRVLAELVGPVTPHFDGLRPWWLSRVSSGRAKWLVLEGYAGRDIPDISAVRANLFDADWSHLGSTFALTGYRMFIRDAKLIRKPKLLDRELIFIRTYGPSGLTEGERERQFYAILEDRIALVRLEDGDGRPLRNRYFCPATTLGPALPDRTFDEWTAALYSTDVAEALEALVWLAGRHQLSTEERLEDECDEPVEDSQLFEAVLGWAHSGRLEGVDVFSNPWVQEGVQLVFRRDRDRSSRTLVEQLTGMWSPPAAIGAAIVLTVFLLWRIRRRRRLD